jgi:autotransporter-associated beta strand protein
MGRANKSRLFVAVGGVVAGLAAFAPGSARGQSYLWNTETSGTWSDGTKWDLGVPVPGTTTALTFAATGTSSYTATNDLTPNPFILNALAFNNTGTGLITLAGNGLALAGTTPTFTVSNGTATVGNVVSGASTLNKAGAGTLFLTGANTYTGITTIAAGTLVYAANPVTSATTASTSGGFATGTITSSPLGTGAVTLAGGATLAIDGTNRVMRNALTVTGTPANPSLINIPTGAEFTTTGTVIGGSGTAITKNGDGLWRITFGTTNVGTAAANSFGTLTINAGTVQLVDTTGGVTTGGGDIGPDSILVKSGARFLFGNNPLYTVTAGTTTTTENTDLPNNTILTVNGGGVAEFVEGEDFGGIILDGGAVNIGRNAAANFPATGRLDTDLRIGTINAITGIGTGGVPAFGANNGARPINKTTSGTVTITGVTLGQAQTINIMEGLLVTDSPILGAATNPLTFGTASTAGALSYTGTANMSSLRPLTLNAGGGAIGVTAAGATMTVTGALSGAGGLTKTGAGALTLTGALGQSGLLTVAGGTLRVNPVTTAGGLVVQSGGTLAVNSGAGTATLSTPTLALGGTGSTLRFELATATVPSPAVPLVNVTNDGGLTLGTGSPTLAVANTAILANGTYQLIDYAGAPITSGFGLQLPGRTAANLVYNTVDTRIDLEVTGTQSVTWTGAAGSTWDAGTAPDVGGTTNFKLSTSGTPTNFINSDVVVFDDSAATKTVNLAAALQPTAVTVDTAATYTFQGAGSLAGTAPLTKQGTGTLVLATDNTISGAVTVTAGTLQVGTGGTAGSTGTGAISVAAGATLAYNRSDTSTFRGAISGGGAIVKSGAGSFVLDSSNSPFTGTLTINGGTFRVSDSLSATTNFNATSIVVNSGGKFEFFGPTGNANLPETAAGGTVVTVNAGAVAEFTEGELLGGLVLAGGTINTSLGLGITNGDGTVQPVTRTILQSGTINNIVGGAGDINNVGNIRKTTANTVTVTGVTVSTTGALGIEQGVLSTDAAISGATGTLTFGTAATAGTLQYRGASTALTKPVAFAAGGGTVEVTQAGTTVTFAGVLSGAGTLTKAGSGVVSITANSTYAGGTTVSAGTLLVNNPTVATASGTGSGLVTVAAGAVLGGSGSIAGAVSITGTLAPGNSPGVLTVAGATTFNPGSLFAVEVGKLILDAAAPVAGTDYDQLALTGTGTTLALAPGARLSIAESGHLQNGQTFRVVDNTTSGTLSGVFSNLGGTTLADGATVFGDQGGRYTISYDDGDVVLTAVNVVPEPAAAGLLAAGGLLLRRRRSHVRPGGR